MALSPYFSTTQKLQLLHIAYPDVFEAASTDTPVWLSLWLGEERMKIKAKKAHPYIDGGRIVIAPSLKWGPVSFAASSITLLDIGIAWKKKGHPFIRVPCHGLYGGQRVEPGETITCTEVRATVNE